MNNYIIYDKNNINYNVNFMGHCLLDDDISSRAGTNQKSSLILF